MRQTTPPFVIRILVVAIVTMNCVEAFQVITVPRYCQQQQQQPTYMLSNNNNENEIQPTAMPSKLSRRNMVLSTLGVLSSVVVSVVPTNHNMYGIRLIPPVAWSASTASASASAGITADDKLRIQKGYQQLKYLLDNFDQETTVCRENGGECKRNAEAIRRALGLRSTTDVFFQIEKVFAKAKNTELEDYDKLEQLFDAIEDWDSAISMSNSMAFISQFGEYNPGGGADSVLKYLLESKKQVELAKTSLELIMDSLSIPKA